MKPFLPHRLPTRLLSGLLGSTLLLNAAWAGPTGGAVTAGQGTITGQGTQNVTINQSSQRVVIHWDSFNTSKGESVRFYQPNSNAIALNRITNGSPTSFNGALSANGKVIVMNPNGVVFGASSKVDVGGLLATTADIADDNFMNDARLVFDKAGDPNAKIINHGQISVKDAGLAGFVAPHVENNGIIQARLGKVHLASGSKFTLDLAGDELVQIALDDTVAKQIVKNAGTIQVDGGTVLMTAAQARASVDALITNTGTVEATSATTKGGTIVLNGEGADLILEGTLNASGVEGGTVDIKTRSILANGVVKAKGTTQKGGTVKMVAAKSIEAAGGTIVDVSGATGGKIIQNASGSVSSGSYKAEGTSGKGGSIDWGGNISLLGAKLSTSGQTEGGSIHLGGLWKNPTVDGWDVDGVHLDPAQNIFLSAQSELRSAVLGTSGNGGEVVLRAQKQTYFAGLIDTRPGTQAGQGGRAEVSGSTIQLPSTQSITTGRSGRNGEVLLDPKNITITNTTPPDAIQTVKMAFGYALNNTDLFGHSVALNSTGDLLAVGAVLDDSGGTDRGAIYLFTLNPSEIDYAPVFQYKLKHGTAGLTLSDNSGFGISVAFNGTGNVLAAGSYLDDTGGTDRGAVYLFSLNPNSISTSITMQRKIAHGIDGVSLADGDGFGLSVSLNNTGDILAAGAFSDNTGGTDRGAVYLFNIDPANLSAASTLRYKLAHGSAGLNLLNQDRFGYSVALNGTGDILAVGAQRDDAGGALTDDKGAVYLFNLDTSNLTTAPVMRKKIASGSPGVTLSNGDYFGGSVALNDAGNILAVGAFSSDLGGQDRGAVYLFNLNTSDLTQDAILRQTISHGSVPGLSLANTDNFGRAVALNGTGSMLVAGAPWDSTGSTAGGAIYAFGLNPSDLTITATLRNKVTSAPGGSIKPGDNFGSSVDFNYAGNLMAVGAVGDDTGGTNRGAVYLFTLDPNNPTKSPVFRYKIASGTSGVTLVDDDRFGESVSLNNQGNILAVGATGRDAGGTDRGAVYLFNVDTNNLTTSPVYRSTVSNVATAGLTLANSDSFGSGVELNGAGNILVVGAQGSDLGGADRGAVFIFSLNPLDLTTGATYQKTLSHGVSGLNLANSDMFGRDVSLNDAGNILAVGAYQDGTGGSNRGAVYLFNLNTGNLSADPTFGIKLANGVGGLTLADGDNFGNSIDLNGDGNILAVGAPGTNGYQGAASLFLLDPTNLGATPLLLKKIVSGTSGVTLNNVDLFGSSVALNGTGSILAVGATNDDTDGRTDSGAVRIFQTSNLFNPAITNPLNYANNPGLDALLSVSTLTALLSGANNVTLQANNDIFVNSDIFVNNASGDGGDLTLQAGRSVVINAHIITDNGDLIVIANDTLANGVVDAYRDPGAANITVDVGKVINAGTGSVSLVMRDGAGKTNSTSGNVSIGQITAGNLLVESQNDIETVSNTTISGAGTITYKAKGNILLGYGVATTAGGDILVNSDWDGNGAGGIKLNNGAELRSNGGNITLAGGVGANDYAVGTSAGQASGVYLGAFSVIDASGTSSSGSVVIKGKGWGASTANVMTWENRSVGIMLNGATVRTGHAGTITMNGQGDGAVGSASGGIFLLNGGQIIGHDGTISLTGIGGGAGAGDFREGVIIGQYGNNFIQSTGTGDINIFGHGADGSNGNGIVLNTAGATNGILSKDGDVTLTGTTSQATNLGIVNGYGDGGLVGGPNATGTITLITNKIYFGIQPTFQTTGDIIVRPYTPGTTVAIGTGGTLVLTTAMLNNMIWGGTLWIGGYGNVGDAGYINDNASLSIHGSVTYNGNVRMMSAGDIILGNATTTMASDKSLQLDAGGRVRTVAAGGSIATGSGSLVVNGATGINLLHTYDIMSTSGDITLSNNILLGANQIFDAGTGTLTFGGTVNGAYDLTASAGTIDLNAAWGGSTALNAASLISTADHLSLPAIRAASIFAQSASTKDITLTGALTATGSGNSIVLNSGRNFINSGGSLNSGPGRYLVYSVDPAQNVMGGITGYGKRYNTTYAGDPPAGISGTDDKFLYSLNAVLTITADDKTKVYGSANPGFTYTATGFIDGDTSAILSGSAGFSTTADNTTGVGTYGINISANTLANDYNYTFNFVDGNLSITPKALTITADNKTKVYGSANPALTASYAGFVNGDDESDLTGLILSTGATSSSGVGNYGITASGASNANYTISYVGGNLSVTPAALTITADNKTKVYGSANPTLTASYSGFVNGDDANDLTGLLLSTGATSGSGVGNYGITASGASNANYTISYVGGTLSITPKALTITADNKTKVEGTANPVFTASYSGFVNGDNASVVSGLLLDSLANASSPAGSYAITASGGTAANYTITHVNGTLTVTSSGGPGPGPGPNPGTAEPPTNYKKVFAWDDAALNDQAPNGENAVIKEKEEDFDTCKGKGVGAGTMCLYTFVGDFNQHFKTNSDL